MPRLNSLPLRLISLHNQAFALCSSYEVQERNFVSKMRNRRKKSAEECIITGVIVGQGQLMPRNGCNERGPGSPHGNDLCTGVTRPHGPIKSDIGAGNVLETCLPRSRHPLPGTLVG